MNFGNHITEIPVAQTCWPKTNCGNTIAEIGEKKNFVAMPLPKMGGKKIIMVAEIWEEIKKKYYVHNIFTTFSQQITGN